MVTATVMAAALTTPALSGLLATLFPASLPLDRDPYSCATKDVSQYFNFPTPTGALQSAIFSHGKELMKTCTLVGTERTACAQPDRSQWCALSTAAPSSVLTAYSSYGSSAASWWAAHSSAVVSVAQACPAHWSWALGTVNQSWLNGTINFGECYAGGPAGKAASTTTSTATPRSAPSVSVAKVTSANAANRAF